MMFFSTTSLLILTAAVLLVLLLRRSFQDNTKWHEGDDWNRFFRVYDELAKEQFGNCESKKIESRFGSTQVHICGSRKDPEISDDKVQQDDVKSPVFLLHGLASQSLIFGNWLVPSLAESHYTVSIDSLCDVGRSYPKNGDPKSCPQTSDELSEWIIDIADQLNIPKQTKVDLVGYSYGGFVAAKVALDNPDRFGKLAIIACSLPFRSSLS